MQIDTWWDEAEITAPIEIVWQVVVNVAAWPTWHEFTMSVETAGPMAKGSQFEWAMLAHWPNEPRQSTVPDLVMRMTVCELWEHRRIVCSSLDDHGTTGIHEWTFESRPDGVWVERRAYFYGPAIEADWDGETCELGWFKDRWMDDAREAAEAKWLSDE